MANGVEPIPSQGQQESGALRALLLRQPSKDRASYGGSWLQWQQCAEQRGLVPHRDGHQRIEFWCRPGHPRLVAWQARIGEESSSSVFANDGSSVEDLFRLAVRQQQSLPELLVASLLVQALEALAYLSEKGIDVPICEMQHLRLDGPEPAVLLTDPSRDPKLRLEGIAVLTLFDPCSLPLLAFCARSAPEVQCGQVRPTSAIYSLGVIGKRLLEAVPPPEGTSSRRSWIRWRTPLERAIRNMLQVQWDRRPTLQEAHEQIREMAMDLFAANYRSRRISVLENKLEEFIAVRSASDVRGVLDELRDLGARGPYLGLARVWLDEQELRSERLRVAAEREAGRSLFPAPRPWCPVFRENSPRRFQVWLTITPMVLALTLSLLIAFVLWWSV